MAREHGTLHGLCGHASPPGPTRPELLTLPKLATGRVGLFRLFLALVALVGSMPAAAAEKLVLFVEPSAPLVAYHREVAASFAEEKGVEVEVVVASGNYPEQVQVRLAAGAQIDVTQLWAEEAAPLMAAGAFRGLTPHIERESQIDIADFAPPRVQSFTWNDELLALPLNANVFLGLYNRDAFASAGLAYPEELGDGWTWETMRDYARRLSLDRDGDGAYDVHGISTDVSLLRSIPVFVEQAGGRLFDRYANPTRATASAPDSLTGLEFMRTLFQEDRTARVGDTWAWRSGDSAMALVSGPFELGANAQANLSFDWGVMRLPKGPAHGGTIMLGVGYQITASSAHPDLAWELIKRLGADVESVGRMVAHTGRTPGFIPALQYYRDYLAEHFPEPTARLFADEVASPVNFPGPITPVFSDVNGIVSQYVRQMVDGLISPLEAATRIDNEVGAILRTNALPAE